MRARRLIKRAVLLIVIPAAVLGIALWFWLGGGRWIETENAYVKADMVQVSADVAGRVVAVAVRDHARVAAGDLLFRLDPVPFELALAKADAEVALARARVETMRAAYREARTELTEAENRIGFLARQAERQRNLEARGAGAGVKREEAEHEAEAARDQANTLRQRIQRELAALAGDPNRPTDQHPLVAEAIATRDRAAYDRDRTVITAPTAGVVVNVKLQPGEQVKAATALFGLIASTRPWVEANLKETELTHVRVGQAASIVVDAYPDVVWKARVASISPASGAEFAVLPPQNASGNWVKVVQRLPVRLQIEEQPGREPLRAGMTVAVRIDTGRERSLSGLMSALASGFRGPQDEAAR